MRYFVQWQCDPHHYCVMPCQIILVDVVGHGGFCHYFGIDGKEVFFHCVLTDTCGTTWLISYMFNSWQMYFLSYLIYYRNLQADHYYHPFWSFILVSLKLLFRSYNLVCFPSVRWKNITMCVCVCVCVCVFLFTLFPSLCMTASWPLHTNVGMNIWQ